MNATEAWNQTVANTQQKDGLNHQDAWDRARVLHPVTFSNYMTECEQRKVATLANERYEAKAERARLVNTADRANESGEFDSIVTPMVARVLGLTDNAPLSAVRNKLASGAMLNGGVKTQWHQDAVAVIRKQTGLNYSAACTKFLELVPELYPSK